MLLYRRNRKRTLIDQPVLSGHIHPTPIIKHKAQRIQPFTDPQAVQEKRLRPHLLTGSGTQRLCQPMMIKQFLPFLLVRIHGYIHASVRSIPHIPKQMSARYPLRIHVGIKYLARTEFLLQCISTAIIIRRTLSNSHAPAKEHGYQQT